MYWAEVKSDFYQITVHMITSIHYILWLKITLTKIKGKYMLALLTLKAFDSIWHQGLFYKLIESGIGGKTYDLIKSMYTESKCGIKINTKRTRYLSQEHYLTFISMNWRSIWSDLQPLGSLYTTHRSDAYCMQMYWFCCLPLNMVYTRTWTCWSNTARPGPWQSTWRKPTLWSFRKDPDPREHNTHLH